MKLKYYLSKPFIDFKEINNVKKVLESGWLSYGKISHDLEKMVSKELGFKNTLAVNSCTSGIHSLLVANNIKDNDEVLTSPFTFVSTINSLYHQKSKIILCDINKNDFNIDINEIKKKISNRTKCILPTHYGGNPCDIENIIKFKQIFKDLIIIEDAATALGAKIKNKYVGSYNTDGCVFSLYANKVITSGEGGLISVKNPKIYKKLKEIIFCGINKDTYKRNFTNKLWEYNVNMAGYKYNLSDINASIALSQFKKLEKIINYREKLRKIYNHQFKFLFEENIISPLIIKNNNSSSNYIYCFLLNPKKIKIKRDELISKFVKSGIGCSVHYIPAHKHNFYKKMFKKFELKNTNYVYDNIVSIPMHNYLKEKDVIDISDIIIKKIKKNVIKK